MEFNGGAQAHVYTCSDPCWSGRGHDKQLGNHRFHLWGMLAMDLLEVDSSEMDIDMKWKN